MEKTLYIYIDETGTPSVLDEELFGLGALLSERPIQQQLIDVALKNLGADKDFTPLDQETLDRGYFHGSEDSANGHSLLCREVAS